MMRRVFLPITLVGLAACATVDPDAGIRELDREIASRGAPAALTGADRGVVDTDLDSPAAAARITLIANPRVAALLAALTVSEADRAQAAALPNPVLELAAGFEDGESTELEIGLVQSLVALVNRGRRVERADAEAAAHRFETAHAILRIVADAEHAWVDAVAAGQREYQHDRLAASADAALDFTQRLHAAGNIDALTLERARARHASAQADLEAASSARRVAEQVLRNLLAMEADGDALRLRPRLPEPADGTPGSGENEDLGLAARRARIESLAAAAGIADTAGWFDEFAIGVHGERDDGDWRVGPSLELSLPVFDAGGPRRVRARARLEQAAHEYAAAVLDRETTLARLRAQVEHSRAKVAHFTEGVLPAHARVVEQAMRQHNAMQIGVFDLLDAHDERAGAWADYIDALSDYWHARIELDLAIAGAASW